MTDVLTWHRIKFVFTITDDYLFPQLTMGLALLIVVLKVLAIRLGMAFPKAYSTAFSGFFLALMIVLWLLILRGVAIEFRSHQDNSLWREFWDSVFSFASILMAVLFGASLGILVRGVPIGKDGLAGLALFTNFRTGRHPGIFDCYTTLVGIFAPKDN